MDGTGRDQLPVLKRFDEAIIDDEEAATTATILRVAVRRPARKRRADHVHAYDEESDSSDGERRMKEDEHDCGPEATEVAEACALWRSARMLFMSGGRAVLSWNGRQLNPICCGATRPVARCC